MINFNVLQKPQIFELKGEKLEFFFSMVSMYELFTEFNYKNEKELNAALCSKNAWEAVITAAKVFYCGLDIKDQISFDEFIKFFSTKSEIINMYEFVFNALQHFYTPEMEIFEIEKKKTIILISMLEDQMDLTLMHYIF